MEIRLATSASDPAIRAFGELQQRVYFEPEMLIPGHVIGHLIQASDPQRKNLLLVAEDHGRVLGGTFFHAMMDSRCGFSSFMGIDSDARGRGIARSLHEARLAALDAAFAAPAHGVFIDVEAPERLPADRIGAERRFGFDPFTRRRIFQALGFRKVDLPYEQPVGGPNGGPVTTLDLLFCPREPSERLATELVLSTMRAYWTPWLGAQRAARAVERLREFAGGDWVALLPAA
jgi:GNAT superfamily N-acetyltransferase